MERMNNGILKIDGHEYTIEKMTKTRELYRFNDRNSKGEEIMNELINYELLDLCIKRCTYLSKF